MLFYIPIIPLLQGGGKKYSVSFGNLCTFKVCTVNPKPWTQRGLKGKGTNVSLWFAKELRILVLVAEFRGPRED